MLSASVQACHNEQVHLLEWARAVIATSLGVLPSRALPPLMMQQEAASVWDQICTSLPTHTACLCTYPRCRQACDAVPMAKIQESTLYMSFHCVHPFDMEINLHEIRVHNAVSPLEGFGPREWVCFERALVVRDMFLGGERTFLSQEDARAFRSMIYAQYGERSCLKLPRPPHVLAWVACQPWSSLKPSSTLQATASPDHAPACTASPYLLEKLPLDSLMCSLQRVLCKSARCFFFWGFNI